MRDSVLILQSKILRDTIIIDGDLAPSHQYKYSLISGSSTYSATAVTMDTTSHEFSWQYFEFGDQMHGSGGFSDVAIVNDTLAYAVGQIFGAKGFDGYDSTGKWISAANAARWDGTSWEQLYMSGDMNGTHLDISGITSVLAYQPNDIWFGVGQILRWNGVKGWFQQTYIEGYALKMYSDEMKNVYLVGTGGQIAYFDGISWKKEESNTTYSITDVIGSNGNVYAAASISNLGKGVILKRNAGQWSTLIEGDGVDLTQIFKPKLYGSTSSLWIDEKGALYAAGNFLYQYKFEKWNFFKSLPDNYPRENYSRDWGFIFSIRGNKSNDFWVAGELNTLLHFNGATWKQIGMPYDSNRDIKWRALFVRGNVCIAVGYRGWQPVAMVIHSR
jgi:hypothetical protein